MKPVPVRAVILRLAIAALALLACPMVMAGQIDFVFEDHFSADERARLSAWIQETSAALESLVGPFPMPVSIHFHRRDNAAEPVPWAHTRRSRVQGVHFHVDTRFEPDAFREDWTAPHELSHLVLPYLGRPHAWFAEGFASYLQYRVMQAMGVLTPAEAQARLQRNIDSAARNYDYPDQPFASAAPRLHEEHRYPVMYWGGAAYFLQVDAALADRGTNLLAVLEQYMACCRRNRDSLEGLLQALDRLSDSTLFSRCLDRFRSRPGFPAIPGRSAEADDEV